MTSPSATVRSAQGIDVSNFQGHFAWSATSGLSFGVHRLTQGLSTPGTNSPDPTAQWNHAEIAKRGLHRGVYHFLDPRKSGAAQAAVFVAAYHDLGLTASDMLWLDNEVSNGEGPAMVAQCARAFMAELDKLCPRNPRGVYTFLSFAAGGYCTGLDRYALWIAHPAAAAPSPAEVKPWPSWKFWQYGIRNGVDRDAFNGTAADLDAWIRSFAPPPHPPGPVLHVTAGQSSLAGLARQHHTVPTVVLRETFAHSPGGVLPPGLAGYVNGVLTGHLAPTAPMPAGLPLWLPGTS